MAINPETQYPGKITASSPQYPYGEARNITAPGDGTGTPWEAAVVNDLFGWQQALLSAASEVPTGTPDKADASQYLQSQVTVHGRVYDSVASMVADQSLKAGQKVSTIGHKAGFAATIHGPVGGANYVIVTAAEFTTIQNGTPVDEMGDHTLDNALIALLDTTGYDPVTWWGAQGDAAADDTASIQACLDAFGNGRVAWFPKGTYSVTSAGAGPCLTMTKNVSLDGVTNRGSAIRADSVSATSDVIEVSITDNGGLGDIRDWSCTRLKMFFNGGGRHCLHKTSGGGELAMFNSIIAGCVLTAVASNGGRSFIADGGWAFSNIERSNLIPGVSLLGVADGNQIVHNIFSGTSKAVVIDLIQGAYQTDVSHNTMVNRDGAVHIINGEQVKIRYNQIEHAQGQGENMSADSSHIFIEGADYRGFGVDITGNNLGGGTNLDNLINIDRASNTIIDKNDGNAANPAGFDIVMSSLCQYTKVMKSNTWLGNVSNPRTGDRINVVVSDSGKGNYGVLQDLSALTTANGWVGSGDYYKDAETGQVVILGAFNSGTTTAGTKVADFPDGFFADQLSNDPAVCSGGLFMGDVNTLGAIKISTTAPSNSGAFKNYRFNAQGDEQ